MIAALSRWMVLRNPALTIQHARRIIRVGFIAAAALLLILALSIRSCTAGRQQTQQAGQDARSAAALAETARDAAATVIAQAREEASVDELVSAAIKEIDNAPTDEMAGAAARRAICGLPDYRADPACQLHRIHP